MLEVGGSIPSPPTIGHSPVRRSADDPAGGRKAGLRRCVHPHLFRYSAATWMRPKGVDPLTIARVMGRTSLRMLQRIYDQASPVDDFSVMAGALGNEERSERLPRLTGSRCG